MNFMEKGLLFLETTGFDCGGADVLGVIKFVWTLLDVVFIIVPIGLIVMVSLDFAKNVIAGKEDEMKKNVLLAFKRIMYCVALFLVMPIVNFVIVLLGEQDVSYAKCIEIATTEDLSQYKIEYDDDYNVPEPDFSKDSGYSTSNGNNMSDEDYKHLDIYNQTNPTIASNKVCIGGAKSVSATACGLSTYMATRYVLTKQDTNYMDFAHEACGTGFFNGNGTSWEVSEKDSTYSDKYGIVSSGMMSNYDAIVGELKKGRVVVLIVHAGRPTVNEGGFNSTSNQHFIALVGYDGSKEQIYVYNPTGKNTGWTSKDMVQKYIINYIDLIRSVKAV
ncbi:MAG: C39 family peptidase [Erysipelotrichaceae bacterium]|nr:C39 family peptidase [Erysipelotrichaceae bacterium]